MKDKGRKDRKKEKITINIFGSKGEIPYGLVSLSLPPPRPRPPLAGRCSGRFRLRYSCIFAALKYIIREKRGAELKTDRKIDQVQEPRDKEERKHGQCSQSIHTPFLQRKGI